MGTFIEITKLMIGGWVYLSFINFYYNSLLGLDGHLLFGGKTVILRKVIRTLSFPLLFRVLRVPILLY